MWRAEFPTMVLKSLFLGRRNGNGEYIERMRWERKVVFQLNCGWGLRSRLKLGNWDMGSDVVFGYVRGDIPKKV